MPQKHQRELQRFQRDIDYFETHQQELLDQYPEKWVAIFNGRVVGDESDPERLLRLLEERKIPIEKALLRHVTAREETFILVR